MWQLLALFQHPQVEVRRLAIGCCNNLMSTMPAALYDSLDHYLNELFTLRNDTSVAVRTLVCAGLVQFLNMTPERLQTHLRELVQYMLHATQDAEPEVALEACEFWSAFCESQLATHYSQVLQEFLPSLIPILLRNMSYADDDEDALLAEALLRVGGGELIVELTLRALSRRLRPRPRLCDELVLAGAALVVEQMARLG